MRVRFASVVVLVALCALPSVHAETAQGITSGEIVVGSILDLSGPMAPYGLQVEHGMQMRVAEINRQGGVNGRTLRLLIEDSGSEEGRASQAISGLIERDQIFALIGTLGGPANHAVMPLLLKHGVISFLPIASLRATYEPADRLKVAFMLPAAEQLRIALPYLFMHRHYQHLCSVSEDGEFGSEVTRATDLIARRAGASAERIVYAHGAADYGAIAGRLRGGACDMVVIGSSVTDAVGIISEARRTGLATDFVGTTTLYSNLVHELGGKAVEGVYAVNTVSQPYADDASKLVRDWTEAYRRQFTDEPSVYSVYGWVIVDLFAKAASKAGPLLTVYSFNASLQNNTYPRDMFGSPEFHVTDSDRLGNHQVRVSQIVGGKWVAISTLLDPPSP